MGGASRLDSPAVRRHALPLALAAALAACAGDPPITMPAGFESARPGSTLADVRAARPKAELKREGGDVFLHERGDPPRFRDAELWLHAASEGPAPPDDQLRVNRVILSTLDREGLAVGAREAGQASPSELEAMRRTVGDRFEQMRKATETSFGRPTRCELLSCVWSFRGYEVKLFALDALDPAGEPVPIGVRYAIRLSSAAPVEKPPPAAPPGG